jgi:flagellin FlaB
MTILDPETQAHSYEWASLPLSVSGANVFGQNGLPSAKPIMGQRGVTGIETAIILIAFVVVASVFAFTVLSTGVFSAERGKETVYAGLSEAMGSLDFRSSLTAVRGDVEGTNGFVKLRFVVGKGASGEGVNLTAPNTTDDSAPDPDAVAGALNVMNISYSDQSQYIGDLDWTVDFIGKSNGDDILDDDEQAEITVWLHDYDGTDYNLGTSTNTQYLTTRLGINTKFRIEVRPDKGGILSIERNTPKRLQPIADLN